MLPFTTTWGWGTWKRAWSGALRHPNEALKCLADYEWRERFDIDGAFPYARMLADQLRGRKDSWGIWWYFHVFQHRGLVVYPTRTYVHNEGFDGSGTHCADNARHFDGALGLTAPTCLPDVSDMPEAIAAVREHLRQARGFPRRIKDRWMRFFPSLPKAKL